MHACLGNIDQSLKIVKNALIILYDDPRPIQLYILLLTCQKDYIQAYKIVEEALEQFSTNLNFIYLKIRLMKYVSQEHNLKNLFLDFQEIYKTIYRYLNNSRHYNLSSTSTFTKTVSRLLTYESSQMVKFSDFTHVFLIYFFFFISFHFF